MSHLKSCQFINSFNQSEVSKFDDDLPINSSQIAKVASSSWCNHFIKLGKLKTHPGNPNLFWNILPKNSILNIEEFIGSYMWM